MEKENKKVLKKIVITIFVILGILLGLIIYAAIQDLKQEEILKQEIVNYSNLDLANDDFSIHVKTTGDYAYVEEAVKKYYKKLSDNVKTLNKYLNNDKFTTILTVENLATDKPDFAQSHTTIRTSKEKISKSIQNISDLCDEKTIKTLLDKDKLDDEEYYYDFYLKLIYTDQDKKDFEKLKQETSELSKTLTEFLDKVDEILIFLENHNSKIQYTSEGLYFSSDQDFNEYKRLTIELAEIGDRIGVVDNSSSKTDNKNKI